MEFRVGPYLYAVRPVAGYIDHQGQRCLGLCDNERHELLISDQASPAQQIQVACHEYMEAWVYHFGANLTDKEDYCDLFGLAMTQFIMDLIRDLRPMLKPEAAQALDLLHGAPPAPGMTPGIASGIAPENVASVRAGMGHLPRPDPGSYRVTRIYEPAPNGSAEPWLMRVVKPAINP
jgi:hypothetical protein